MRCQHCSETDFRNLLSVFLHVEPVRPTQRLIARTAQSHLSRSYPQPTRNNVAVDMHSNAAAENHFDREQAPTRYTQPSSSSHDGPINETSQHKRQITHTDQPSSSRNDTLINANAPHKRQRTDPDQPRHGSRIEEQGQPQDHVSSLNKDTHIHPATQLGQTTQGHNQLASVRRNARNDWANGRGQKESYQNLSTSSRNQAVTDRSSGQERQTSNQKAAQSHARREDIELLTAGMNKLPPPCWGDERVIHPLVQEQVANENYDEFREKRLDYIWGMYGKERAALAASRTPEPEEVWIPETEEVEILERDKPLWEEIWERSVLGGEACMRDILDEKETWPAKEAEEVDIWTREPGGMLSSAVLKQLSRVLTLQESLRDERLERSDESRRAAMRKRDEVTQRFSDDSTSADYPPLAS